MNAWIQWINTLADLWLAALWRACWQGGLALLLVWGLCHWGRRLPVRAKSWLWRLAYLKLIFTFLWTTPIELPWLPAKPATLPTGHLAIENPTAQVVSGPWLGHSDRDSARLAPALPVIPRPNAASWLLMLWGVGMVWSGMRVWRDLCLTRRLRRGCRPVLDERLSRCVEELRQYFRLWLAPNLRVTDAVAGPLLLGIARPVIILPAAMVSEAKLDHLRLMIAHELAHLKRGDLWWVWLAALGETLFFFHPVLWLARKEWRLAQEMACDEMVVRLTRVSASCYGEMLLRAAAWNRPPGPDPILVTLGMAETQSTLKQRLIVMKWMNTPIKKRVAVATGAVLIVGAMNILPWRLVAQVTQAPPASDPFATRPATRVAAEPPAAETAPPEGTPRSGRASTGDRMPGPGAGRMSMRTAMTAPRPPTSVAPARFEATVYEVQVPSNRIADVDARALEAKAATPQDLAVALAAIGGTKVLYKIDQSVNLYGERIMLGTSEPMVTGSRVMSGGQTINSISYQQVGLMVDLSANAPPNDAARKDLQVQVNFELSVLADSGIEISPQVKASSIRNVQLSHSEIPKFGKPSVMLSISAPSVGDKAQAVAYVVRCVFSETGRETPARR